MHSELVVTRNSTRQKKPSALNRDAIPDLDRKINLRSLYPIFGIGLLALLIGLSSDQKDDRAEMGGQSMNPQPQPAWIDTIGLNISGGEFGQIFPGTEGDDYTYPSPEYLRKWIDQEFELYRYQMSYERLVGSDGAFTDDIDRIEEILDFAANEDIKIIPDIHNFMRVRDEEGGERLMTGAELSYFWGLFSQRFAGHPGLAGYGIMTEPFDLEDSWKDIAQSVVNSIRQHDTNTPIIIPGASWSGASNWEDHSYDLSELTDPFDRLVFESHLYLDRDGSGRYECVTPNECGVDVEDIEDIIEPFISWCEENGVACFVGEFGVPVEHDEWRPVVDELFTHLNDNGIGVTVWSAGPWWGEYHMGLDRHEAIWLINTMRAHNQSSLQPRE